MAIHNVFPFIYFFLMVTRMKIDNFTFPEDRFYTLNKSTHLWVKPVDGKSSLVLLGITEFITKNIGEIKILKIKKAGRTFNKDKLILYVDSKSYSVPFYSPFDGKIVQVNETIVKKPKLLNKAPYDNWIYTVEINTELHNNPNLTPVNDAFISYIKTQVSKNAIEEFNCCPDFTKGSVVTKRKK